MAAPNLRAIRDWVNKKIGVIDTSISNTNENVTRVTSDVESVQESVKIEGKQVYLDVQDGVYGFNTSPERGADTFTPFKQDSSGGGTGDEKFKNVYFNLQGSYLTFDLKDSSQYENLEINRGIFIVINNLVINKNYGLSGGTSGDTIPQISSQTYDKTSGTLRITGNSKITNVGRLTGYIYYLL